MDTRATLLETPALTVELLRCRLGPAPMRSAPTEKRQVLFPLTGTFHWHVGRTTNVVDPNHVMFVETDEESADTHPTPTEVTCLIATVAEPTARRLWRSPRPFRDRVARISPRVQAQQMWLANAIRADRPAVWEERVLQLIAAATAEPAHAPTSHAATMLARRAKALFADRGELIALSELAELLDVSPAHLTDSFRRAEGVPIVRYQIQLRIARALRALPHANDLSALALSLGFASHSHFATAFRAHTGLTPSQFRAAARRGDAIETIRKRAAASPG